jgi:SOS-response transcriptional repressor, lexA|nr:MAG TPA: Repressor protein CI [Caudoviricetes sp.]
MSDELQKKIFAKNLRHYLDRENKTQKEVADAIGVSPQTFNTWLQMVALPRMGKVQALADYFGVNKSDLLEEKDSNSLSSSDHKDIAKSLDEMMEQLESGTDSPLMYNGQELSETSKALLRNALEYALTETKKENKVKYNPNKNKG